MAVSILLMLVRPRGIAEVYWIGGGALLLILLRLVPLKPCAIARCLEAEVSFFSRTCTRKSA